MGGQAQACAKEKRNKPKLDCLKTGHFQQLTNVSSHGLCTLTYQREFSVRKFETLG